MKGEVPVCLLLCKTELYRPKQGRRERTHSHLLLNFKSDFAFELAGKQLKVK